MGFFLSLKENGTYSEDDSADIVVKASSLNSILVNFRGTSLVAENETGSNPHGGSAEHESSSNRLAVEQTTGGNDLHGLAGERALVALDQFGNGRDEHCGGDITSVATTLTTLGADDIDIKVKALLDVLGVSDHVHVQHAVLVKLLHDGARRDTDSADKQSGAAFNDDINKRIELSVGVIMAEENQSVSRNWGVFLKKRKEKRRSILGLSCISTNLRKKQVDTEWCVLIVQKALEFGNLVLEHFRGVTDAADNTETTGVRDSGSQLGASGHVHTGEEDGVVDLQEIRNRSTKLLCITGLVLALLSHLVAPTVWMR